MNPLIKIAIRSGSTELVQLHLQRGYDLNQSDEYGVSLLMYAAARGHADICRMLLDTGADPTLRNQEGQDALALAGMAGYQSIVDLLRQAILMKTAVPEPAPALQPDICADEDDPDFIDWEPEVEAPPPEGDADCINDSHTLHVLLSCCRPVDTDADWSDIVLEAPELPVQDAAHLFPASDAGKGSPTC